jgi:hypothetical protein
MIKGMKSLGLVMGKLLRTFPALQVISEFPQHNFLYRRLPTNFSY